MNFYWLCFYSLVPLKSCNDWEDSLSVARGRDPPPPPTEKVHTEAVRGMQQQMEHGGCGYSERSMEREGITTITSSGGTTASGRRRKNRNHLAAHRGSSCPRGEK
jgi:hypothetical protein